MTNKTRCECGWHGDSGALLRAPDPFNEGDELTACPDCRQQDDLRVACEIDGCWRESTCGGTFSDGVYRNTCGPHAEWLHRPAPSSTQQGEGK